MRLFLSIVVFALLKVSFAQNDSIIYGVASYYAKKFEGCRTANGEYFCNDSLTAAHKKLAFGTIVKVTNLRNDSSIIVRINDRLPADSKRTIDLSQASARRLNFIRAGLTKVRIDIISKP